VYVIAWRFEVADAQRAAFEEQYGAGGTWARFFARDPAFIRTQLLREDDGAYVTLDWWRSHEDFARFRAAHRDEYETIDREFETLTQTETRIGGFSNVE
jgi:heme-degrading monooxygenase HmoA